MADGIDVSRWQGTINWQQVRQTGKTFAYVKATEGVDYVSPTLDEQFRGAKAAGLAVGCYHYARPGNSPAADARTFAQELQRLDAWQKGNLPPCLDMEEPASDPKEWVGAFIKALRNEISRRDVMVYASSSYFAGSLAGEAWAGNSVTLWVAHYGRPPGEPSYRSDRVVMHQHSQSGRVNGISGNVDLNRSLVPLSQLTKGSTAKPPKRPSPRTYRVKSGDTLSEIGARLGIDWHRIARINNIRSPYTIHPGQELRLPDVPADRRYTVQPGDTLSLIGSRFDVDWRDIARANKLDNPNLIFPGQILVIP